MVTVNMPESSQKPYHHGNVRLALIDAAVAALQTQSPEDVSIRKLAKTIGVSHNAPYMHFGDKEALWLAVSEAGFARLTAEIEAAIQSQTDWCARLEAGGAAYLRFAE